MIGQKRKTSRNMSNHITLNYSVFIFLVNQNWCFRSPKTYIFFVLSKAVNGLIYP